MMLSAAAALRLICGLAFVPHARSKVREPQASIELFQAVGLRPPPLWIGIAVTIEFAVAACLILDVATAYAAALGGIFLLAAGAAVLRVTGGKWRWNEGGGEFPIFWGLCCFIVSLQAWHGV